MLPRVAVVLLGTAVNILALDLATRTGWALREGDTVESIESGVQAFDVKRGESPGMRYVRFNRWLDEFRRVDLVIFEQAHHRGGAATEVAAGFSTRVLEFAARHKIEHAAVHTATLKKFATGKGNAKKPDMIAAVARRWAPNVTDDNEADALALLHYALSEIVPKDGDDW